MGRFLTVDDFTLQFGEAEAAAIAGSRDFNSLEGSRIDRDHIEAEITFADELIAGYVLGRHPWLRDCHVADIPNLLKGLGGDIVRYRLRDKQAGRGQVSDTVETRYRDALKRLEAIQAGRLDLPRGDDADTGFADGGVARISGPPPGSPDILRGY